MRVQLTAQGNAINGAIQQCDAFLQQLGESSPDSSIPSQEANPAINAVFLCLNICIPLLYESLSPKSSQAEEGIIRNTAILTPFFIISMELDQKEYSL